jgi:OmcA/MtrC family decaheme c-type cytochrome
MKRSIFRTGWKLLLASLLVLSLALAGCEGDDGDDGAPGPAGPPGSAVINAAASTPEALAALEPVGTITSVTIASPPVVEFTVVDSISGVGIAGLQTINAANPGFVRMDIAKLVPPAANSGDPNVWVNYIRSSTENAPTTERTGTLVDHGDGSYAYTFDTDITAVAGIPYQPTLTHRVAGQIGAGNIALPAMNLVFDFVPAGGPVVTTRLITSETNCNQCHNPLVIHGRRFRIDYCVTCHNPDLAQGEGNMPFMTHRIHISGKFDVLDDAVDFAEVTYPQDVRNCEKCHSGFPDSDNWMDTPTLAACSGCHEANTFPGGPIDFSAADGGGHGGGQQLDNSGCRGCHSPQSIVDAHTIFAQEAAKDFEYRFISITNTAPGEFPVVTFEVVNPNTGTNYLLTDDAFTQGGTSTLGVLLGFPTTDITNAGLGINYGQPINLNAKSPAQGGIGVQNADGTITVTSNVAIPLTATGSGMVAIQGHPAAQNPDTLAFERIPVTNVVDTFAITDATAKARRNVISIDNCNRCHEALSLHGNNRSGIIDVCVICHNANATDKARRPADPLTTPDGLAEREIDIKRLIHAIHASDKRETPFIVYGFSPPPNDFSEVTFPGEVNQCTTCHLDGTFELPLTDGTQATTIDTGLDPADPSDDVNITPTTAVCSACHDDALAKAHFEQNGGMFDAADGILTDFSETCVICHGPGTVADVKVVHGVK